MTELNKKPNIIILYADDLGFGDIGCYGAKHIPTPNIDRLAQQSLMFLNCHASAATCTPSRYSLLTGSYPWRNKNAHILKGDAELIIEPDLLTLPSMLKNAGYATGVVGKWHLGLGRGKIEWNEEIQDCPLDLGFDYSFIMAATNDRVPCVYIDGRNVLGLEADDPIEVSFQRDNPFPGIPTGINNPELLKMKYSHGHDMSIVNGVSRIGYMRGGKAALWKDEEMAEVFVEKAKSFINQHTTEPFFLYYAFHQPHVPRLPGERFQGVTELGSRGDVIVEMDWCVGEILDTIEKLNLGKDTIIIFSSDNGPVLNDGYEDQAEDLNADHMPAGALRGGKYSMYDGGTRVPFIISWPGSIEPGKSPALASHIDLFASIADLVGQELKSGEAVDSFNLLATFLGDNFSGRNELVTEGIKGKTVYRNKQWVYIPPYQGPAINSQVKIELGNSNNPQLYNLEKDIAQQENLAEKNKSVVNKMSKRLKEILNSKYTRKE